MSTQCWATVKFRCRSDVIQTKNASYVICLNTSKMNTKKTDIYHNPFFSNICKMYLLLRPVHTYTTRHDSMRHDPFFCSPYNQMDKFTHMQHDLVCSSRQKAAATKIALEAIFVMCCSDSIKKTAKENSFNRNLIWVYKFTMQEWSLKPQYLQFNVTQLIVL